MAAIRSFTSLEQSRKLAEFLPLESADMCWYLATKDNPKAVFNEGYNEYGVFELPCWSLAALLGVLPYGYSSILTKSFNGKDYYCEIDGKPLETKADNPVDACYEMILKLNELKML